MPTGVVSIITDIEEEEQVVAMAAEASEAFPASSEVKEDEKEADPGEEEHKDDEEIKENGLNVTDELQMAPLSPLKVREIIISITLVGYNSISMLWLFLMKTIRAY